ncbi:MAG TPA: hypothetical protein DCS43_05530 [Verrucomicrobia bacterium]|nr:hypothetical protein [Verrucomicrobiota bacterium]
MKEQQNNEWKKSWDDDYLKWICGFANAQGGRLVIGKDNAGEVVGISNARRRLEDLPNKIRDLLGIMVAVNLKTAQGKEYLEIEVEPYPSAISLRGRYQDEVHGNLFAQAQRPFDLLLTKYMKAYIHYEGVRRIDRFLFPRDALREVLHNALVHRDYSTGVPIQIRVYEDRIRFYNDGCLPPGWTVKRLMKSHKSAAESEPTSMMVEFKGVVPDKAGPEEHPETSVKSSVKTGVETRGETQVDSSGAGLVEGLVEDSVKSSVKGQAGDKGSTTQEAPEKSSEKILELLCKDKDMTIFQLADHVKITTRAIEKNIKKLQDAGKLRRVGPDKGGHWEVLEENP